MKNKIIIAFCYVLSATLLVLFSRALRRRCMIAIRLVH